MGHMHGSDVLGRRGLFQKCVDSFLVQAGLEEILQFGEDLVDIGSQLDLQARPLLYGLLAETAELLKVHQVKVVERDKPVGILHHKCLGNEERVDFVSLGLADVVLAHDRCLDGVQHTHAIVTGDKVSDKVVAVVCRGFKTDDDAVAGAGKLLKAGLQHLEAITVIREFERLHEFLSIRRYG